MLTCEGSGAAAIADVLDVALLPDAGLVGGEVVELLLRIADNPRIIPEHNSGHPLQVGMAPPARNPTACLGDLVSQVAPVPYPWFRHVLCTQHIPRNGEWQEQLPV
jgi:hypothetical protein